MDDKRTDRVICEMLGFAGSAPTYSPTYRVETPEGGVRALFFDAQNTLRGFAVTGSVISEKTALEKEAPALL